MNEPLPLPSLSNVIPIAYNSGTAITNRRKGSLAKAARFGFSIFDRHAQQYWRH